MKILFITPYPPYPPEAGGKIRSYNLIREVARHHDVVLFTLADATDLQKMTDHFSRFLGSVEVFPVEPMGWFRKKRRPDFFRHFHSPGLEKRLVELLSRPGIDVIHVEELCLLDALPRTRVPRVLGRQKIDTFFYRALYESDGRLKSFKWQSDLVKMVGQEKRAKKIFQGHVVCSQVDANRLQVLTGKINYRVVPNGVDLEYFKPAPCAADERRTLVFTGSMDYEPNVDGAHFFVEEIWPKIREQAPDVEVLFVGHRPIDSVLELGKQPGVTITGSVDDVRPYIRDASAVIVPIRIGEGTRLKILEAMAMRKPVVSTPPGAEGLRVKDGANISLAKDAEDFALRTLRLLENTDEAERIAVGGHETVSRTYGWNAIALNLLKFYEDLAAGGGP